ARLGLSNGALDDAELEAQALSAALEKRVPQHAIGSDKGQAHELAAAACAECDAVDQQLLEGGAAQSDPARECDGDLVEYLGAKELDFDRPEHPTKFGSALGG